MFAYERDVLNFVDKKIGVDGRNIVKYLMKRGNVMSSDIAEALKIRENIVRKILYEIDSWGCLKTKKVYNEEDRRFEYYVWILVDKFEPVIEKDIMREIENVKKAIEKLENERVYSCGREGHPIMTMDEAFEYNFTCPICGEIMYEMDQEDKIHYLRNKLKDLEDDLKTLKHHYKLYTKKKRTTR